MLTNEQKEALHDFAVAILRQYNISLIPAETQFQTLEFMCDKIDFGILYDTEIAADVSVSRQGQIAIIRIPCKECNNSIVNAISEVEKRTKYLMDLAYGMAILFLQMGYHGDMVHFQSFHNMEWQYGSLYFAEELNYLRDELLIPKDVLSQYVEKHKNSDNKISTKEVAKALGLSWQYVRHRLQETNIIAREF